MLWISGLGVERGYSSAMAIAITVTTTITITGTVIRDAWCVVPPAIGGPAGCCPVL